MKVKDFDNGKRCGLIFPVSTKLNDIHEYLNRNYNGYKFAIVLDETKDEFQFYDEIFVEFLNDLCGEIAEDRGDVLLTKQEYDKLKCSSNNVVQKGTQIYNIGHVDVLTL